MNGSGYAFVGDCCGLTFDLSLWARRWLTTVKAGSMRVRAGSVASSCGTRSAAAVSTRSLCCTMAPKASVFRFGVADKAKEKEQKQSVQRTREERKKGKGELQERRERG